MNVDADPVVALLQDRIDVEDGLFEVVVALRRYRVHGRVADDGDAFDAVGLGGVPLVQEVLTVAFDRGDVVYRGRASHGRSYCSGNGSARLSVQSPSNWSAANATGSATFSKEGIMSRFVVGHELVGSEGPRLRKEIGRASCRERV